MPVTVLYPEERQIPDDSIEQEIFGPEVRILRPTVRTLPTSLLQTAPRSTG
jgi:hypothetical protein